MVATVAASFFTGAYIQAQQYEKVFVQPYLSEITRNQIYTATLLREGIADPEYSENYGLSWLAIAKGLEMEEEHTLKLFKSYVQKYDIQVSQEIKELLAPYEAFEIDEKMVEAMKEGFLVGREDNYATQEEVK